MNLILASASPRRKEILSGLGYEFEVCPADADESVDEGTPVSVVAEILARKKALAVLDKNQDAVVIGSDTVVAVDDKILGKPKNEADAEEMLRMLSGKTHQVYTGLCVCSKYKIRSLVSKTDVSFYTLSDETIKSYVKTKEPMDKAGAYGIQGKGSVLVKKIDGDFFSVMGLPAAALSRLLDDFGVCGDIRGLHFD